MENRSTDALQGLSNDQWNRLGFITMKSARYQAFQEITDAAAGLRTVFPTGFSKLDRQLLGGFTPGKLYVISGRPGSGKSFFSNELLFRVLNGAKADGKKVICLYFTFEMPAKQQIMRLITRDMKMGMSELLSIDGELPQHAITKAIEITERYNDLPIFFKQVSTTVNDAFMVVKKVHEAYPDHTIINLWDHSRLFMSEDASEAELNKLVMLTQGLVRMQQKTSCINILLSQLNRNIEQPTRRSTQFQPMLSDLFGSDSVGQEAEVVMMINRPYDLYNITGKYCNHDPVNLLALHIEKNRNGNLGMLPFEVDMSKFTIEERKDY